MLLESEVEKNNMRLLFRCRIQSCRSGRLFKILVHKASWEGAAIAETIMKTNTYTEPRKRQQSETLLQRSRLRAEHSSVMGQMVVRH